MNLFRTVGVVAVLGLGWTSISSCLKAPDFPTTPTITFNSIQVIHIPRVGGSTARDTLVFDIDFQDGDGDLGLDQADLNVAPYNEATGGHNNRSKSNNYFIQPFKLNGISGKFEPFYTPGNTPGEYDGRYPRLEVITNGKPAPLKGTLRYKLPLRLDQISYFPGDVMQFEISIMDRALHQSNTVRTTSVTLGQ